MTLKGYYAFSLTRLEDTFPCFYLLIVTGNDVNDNNNDNLFFYLICLHSCRKY